MTLADADARARAHAVYWTVLATCLAGWALGRASWIALIYGALADLSGLRGLAMIYRTRDTVLGPLALAAIALAARAWFVHHPVPLPWQVAAGLTALAHALFAALSALALRTAHRY